MFETQVLPFSDSAVRRAADAIAGRQCVAAPTETVYGLFADATDAAAVAGIYAAKGRPSFNPLIVHISDLAAAERIALFDDRARDLATRFWPGPLTFVLPLRPAADIASIVTAGLDTVALRVPAHRASQALLRACGKPLAGPSANASGAISPTRADHVMASLARRIPLIVDDGPTIAGLESTILYGDHVLRPGPLSHSDLFPGEEGGHHDTAYGDVVIAPGQLSSHYAPGKPVRLGADEAREGEWLIGFGGIGGHDNLSPRGDVVEAASRLFDALHRADAAPGERIAIAPIPLDGVGVAINDRLRRAAHPR